MTRRMGLTPLQIKNIKPAPKRREYPDGEVRGLYLVVQLSGVKSWAVRYRRKHDDKPRKVMLDGFPSLADARDQALKIRDRARNGHDPAAEKQEAKRRQRDQASELIEDGFRLFLDKRYTQRAIRETTRVETARLLGLKRDPADAQRWNETGNGVLKYWKGKSKHAITSKDVRGLLDEIVTQTPIAANRTLTALKTYFRWELERETLEKSPCDIVRKPADERKKRKRVLNPDELAALWRVCDEQRADRFGRMVQMLILTGCRRDEVREAPWSEFDMAKRVWTIPGERAKNGLEHPVHITDTMKDILERLPRIQGSSGKVRLLFTTSGDTPLSGHDKATKRFRSEMTKKLGEAPPHWTLHDLRRTFSSGLQELGVPRDVREACVNHSISGVRAHYEHYDFAKQKREALEKWEKHVLSLLDGGPESNVVLMRKAAA